MTINQYWERRKRLREELEKIKAKQLKDTVIGAKHGN
jgi:uncharacterized protein YjiS (DUF1127 family)